MNCNPYLKGLKVVSLAINLPGPAASARLRDLGASVIKIEPPTGDPLGHLGNGWYEALSASMEILTMDLKSADARSDLDKILADTDLLITSNRPASLDRLGLGWDTLHAKHPKLCYVAIVGYPPPDENEPGHDLNYQAGFGMLTPPQMPRVLVADLAGAERTVSTALALLYQRTQSGEAGYAMVPLSEAAEAFAQPAKYGVTMPGGILGGGVPFYNIFETASNYLAVGALEPHFMQRLADDLEAPEITHEVFANIFKTRTAEEWETWGKERDLPLSAIKS